MLCFFFLVCARTCVCVRARARVCVCVCVCLRTHFVAWVTVCFAFPEIRGFKKKKNNPHGFLYSCPLRIIPLSLLSGVFREPRICTCSCLSLPEGCGLGVSVSGVSAVRVDLFYVRQSLSKARQILPSWPGSTCTFVGMQVLRNFPCHSSSWPDNRCDMSLSLVL